MPQASILIRTFNEERHVGDLFDAIATQTFRDYEIVVVDSGSSDLTLDIVRGRCDTLVEIDSRDFTFGYSLNQGCAASRGEVVVIVSAHAIPAHPRWLESLLKPFEDPSVAMSFGRHVGVDATKFPERRDFHDTFGELSPRPDLPAFYANNADSAIRRDLWAARQFDPHLTGLEDIAWAKGALEEGRRVVYVPDAAVMHIHDETPSQVYNRYRREAVAAKVIGLPQPPHSRPDFGWFARRTVGDLLATGREFSLKLVREVLGFRTQQWLGTRDGWRHEIDLERERHDLFFQGQNEGVEIHDRRGARFRDLPMPELRPGDVLIKVAYVGVCRTDLEILDGSLGYYQNGRARYPVVPGHEYSGVVVAVGPNGGTVRVGDRVVGECILSCGRCRACGIGSPTACADREEVGVLNRNGAYARYIAAPGHSVHLVPNDVPLRKACLTEPAAVVNKALRRAGLPAEPAECLVVGGGPIGYLTARMLANRGHTVTVVDTNPARLAAFVDFALTSEELSHLSGFDFVVEATGRVGPLRRVLAETRADATLVLVGLPYGEVGFDFEEIVANEKRVIGSLGSAAEDFRAVLKELTTLDLDPLTRNVMPLEDYQRAWDTVARGEALKVILEVHGELGVAT